MRRGGSRVLIVALIVVATIVAVVPAIIARGRKARLMREGLEAAVAECRARYAGARTAADSVRADQWVPAGSPGPHDRDPACGGYRRRNMLSRAR